MLAMRCLSILLTAIAIIFGTANNASADYAKGRAAFLRGDYIAAGEEFESAAKVGSLEAMTALGALYSEGLGVARDDASAFAWYLRAAEGGHIAAQGTLGRLYGLGLGVPKDDAKSLEWARRAAEKGDVESQYIMGVRHAEGRGVKRDSGEALLWFAAAAEQGLVRAQYSAGFLLAQGAAAAKLPAHSQQMRLEAYKWLLIARRNGAADAEKGLIALKRLMTGEQTAAAEKSAGEFKTIAPYAGNPPRQSKP